MKRWCQCWLVIQSQHWTPLSEQVNMKRAATSLQIQREYHKACVFGVVWKVRDVLVRAEAKRAILVTMYRSLLFVAIETIDKGLSLLSKKNNSFFLLTCWYVFFFPGYRWSIAEGGCYWRLLVSVLVCLHTQQHWRFEMSVLFFLVHRALMPVLKKKVKLQFHFLLSSSDVGLYPTFSLSNLLWLSKLTGHY